MLAKQSQVYGLPKPGFLSKIGPMPNPNGFMNKIQRNFPLRPGPIIQQLPQPGKFHSKSIERM